MRVFDVVVYIPKRSKPIEFQEKSILPYWAAIITVQKRVKKKYVKETGYEGVNVFVKRHKNDMNLK